MISKEVLETIAQFDEFIEVPSFEKGKEHIDLVKKASAKLYRYKRYLELRKLQEELGDRDTDIHIVSHAKSGTTLTQMILYQMTTNGDMDFDHLYDVSPWLGWAISFNLEIKESKTRRLFKSHEPYLFLNHIKKGKFIFLIRNSLDVLNSFYHHSKDYYQLSETYENWASKKLEYWYKYNEAWLKNESNLNILYLNYEDTINNKEKQIERIADFIEVDLTDEIKSRIMKRSSFEFMKKHEEKFGEQPNKAKVYNNFIRKGKIGEGISATPESIKLKNKNLAEGYYIENKITKRYYT